VQLTLKDAAITTSCGSPNKTTASAVVSGSGAQTVIAWNGTSPGSKAFAGSGSATIGPFSSVTDADNVDTVTVKATVTDSVGRKATATRTLEVQLVPC
jgi:hypothetical protein